MMIYNRIATILVMISLAMLSPSLAAAALDSRTIPHPEWAQMSGQVEQPSVVKADSGSDSIQAILRPAEGGRVTVDFGAATTGSFKPKANDFIHVRGKAVEREGHVTILAEEVYAEGKVHSIHRGEAAPQDSAQATGADAGSSLPLSPAAPAPVR